MNLRVCVYLPGRIRMLVADGSFLRVRSRDGNYNRARRKRRRAIARTSAEKRPT